MDCAVLDAYGWTDIKTDCGFFADYTEEDEDGNEVEKSIRYRWPDEVRDEVLARLLALNAERHAEEVKLGLVSPDGERLKRTVDDEDGDADAKPTKASRKKSPADKPTSAKGKNANLTGQLDFGGDE
jgi:rRNA maturation endonuclease Nob1